MIQSEIVAELERLTVAERLAVAEAALHLIRKDIQQAERSPVQMDREKQLAAAAEALLADYETDDELTAFAALNGEDFHA
jgi:hypothetical protein